MARSKVQDVPRLPMGVTFTVSGDPNLRAALRRGRFSRVAFVGGGMLLVFGALFIALKILTDNQSFARTTAPTEPIAQDTVVLITPTARIEKGAKVVIGMLREIRWPRDQVPQGAVRNAEEAANLWASTTLPENQPILKSGLSSTAPNYGIGELLAPGNRAVTIAVNATTGIEGWATAGAHVDVLLTYLDREENITKTRIIVENAIVLSYGGNAKMGNEGDKRDTSMMAGATVTVGVPFADSLKITTALDMGRISLALRNTNDIASSGEGLFSADQWDKTHPQVEARPNNVAKGYAKYTNPNGQDKQFVLGNDNRWKDNKAEEFF